MRCWQGDSVDLPAYLGPADVVFMNAVFGNMHDQRAALLQACALLRPGGHVVISHPEGRSWHIGLHDSDGSMVPHLLPDTGALQQLVADLPLQVISHQDEPYYLALLQVSCTDALAE